jgi:hypothetical protein
MSVRSLSHTGRAAVAACALALTVSAPALAAPFNQASERDHACVEEHHCAPVTNGTDVSAPDQQNPIPAPARKALPGPPTWAMHPQTLTPPHAAATRSSAGERFDWGDAGIGAGGALAILVAGLGGVLVIRRRQTSGTAATA